MELPRPALSTDLAPHEHVQQRVQLSRAHAEWRTTRRLSRTGGATYRDVRVAKRAYLQAHQKVEQTRLTAQQAL